MSATIIFQLAGQHYGVEIEYVKEVVPLMKVTQVPQMPRDWYGIASIRQQVTPIVDLRLHMGLPGRAPQLNDPIIILREDERQIGILVDEVSQVLYDATGASVDYQDGMMIINLEVSAIFIKTPDIAERKNE